MQLDAENLDVIRERFIALNQQRLDRCQNDMQPKQRDFLTVLPLLFHINHVNLPGYCGPDTPVGVSAYAFDDDTLAVARRLWRGFEIQKRAQWSYAIESIFLMGSVGTIAFSRKSDFDIWLCVRPDIPKERLESIQTKATGIEKWAEELGIEAHFFLMNAEEFKQGKLGDLSSESSGSAQHRLLIDEFYRTSIWVAGKHPAWWFTPPDREHEYEEILAHIEQNKLVDEDECIDFGALPSIPADEFLGAAVWQLNKAIDSPYKSLLKITLMEAYASEYPNGETLSTKFKRRVYDGDTSLDDLDPYIMLLNYLEAFLQGKEAAGRLELLRISFYFKIGIGLSLDSVKMKADWRVALLRGIVQSWGWTDHVCYRLDTFIDWKIDDVRTARQAVMDSLTKSYMFLSDFARKQKGKSLIKQKDLTILGRKLYAVFEKKTGKTEIVSYGFKNNISEDLVTFLLAKGKSGEHWLLYRGKVTGADFKNFKPLKNASSLVELMVWAWFNRVISMDSRKMLYAPGSDLKNSELHSLLEDVGRLCQKPEKFSADNEQLKFSPVIKDTRFYVNVGRIPRVVGIKIEKEIISGGLDVLKYGSMDESLLVSVDFVYTTTWNEVYVMQYQEMEGLFNFICDFLNFSLDKEGRKSQRPLSVPEFCSISPHFGHILNRRIEGLIKDIYNFFLENEENISGRFVTEAARNLFVIEKKANKFRAQRFGSLSQLIAYLGMPKETYRATGFDKFALTSSPLPAIARFNRPGIVQLFYEKNKKGITVWVIDENGGVFVQFHPQADVLSLLHNYYKFLSSSIMQNLFADQPEDQRDKIYRGRETELLECYSVKKEGLDYVVESLDLNNLQNAGIAYELVAIGEVIKNKTVFRFKYKDQELSSANLGSNVFPAVRKMLGTNEPCFITHMQLSHEIIGKKQGQRPSTLHMLSYKKRIEDKLNR